MIYERLGWIKQVFDPRFGDTGNWYCPDCFAAVQYLGIIAHRHWHRRLVLNEDRIGNNRANIDNHEKDYQQLKRDVEVLRREIERLQALAYTNDDDSGEAYHSYE